MPESIKGRVPWEADGKRHRYDWRNQSKQEWMPKPAAGRGYTELAKKRARATADEPSIYVQIVPGPERTFQIVRVELSTPIARGFRTKEGARKWLARAIKSSILPTNVMEVEPGP